MGLPATLKHFNVFNDGYSYLGVASEVQLPKLELDTTEWSGAGMPGTIDVSTGRVKKLEAEHKYGGLIVPVLRQFGLVDVAGAMLRFIGSYQADDTGAIVPAELVMRGLHTEIDPGKAKTGEATEWGVKTTASYLKWTINGRVEVEIDLLNFLMVIGGVDRLAEHRAALGI